MSEPKIQMACDRDQLAKMAAGRIVEAAEGAIGKTGRFSLVLSGGSTPKALYELLAEAPYKDQVEWDKVHIFFGDERCVAPDHADSNYRMANEAMLSKLPIPPAQVHRMRGEIAPVDAAAEYDALLRSFFAIDGPDVVLLGLGDDAHTASLFPHTAALSADDKLCVSNWVEKLKATRLTMTASFLNRAHEVIFLVAGATKADAVRQVLEGESDPDRLPAQRIKPSDGQLIWLLDVQAAEMEQSQ